MFFDCIRGVYCSLDVCFFYFFYQKTAYEMRISDCSSDVCSSDLNPLEEDGEEDLAAVMEGVPDLVMIPKVTAPEQIARLDAAIGEHEIRLGLAPGSTEIVPNIESARGLTRTIALAQASPLGRAACRERVCQYV